MPLVAPLQYKERRLIGRVEKLWKEAAGDALPSWSDIEAFDLGADRDFCFTVDLHLSDRAPYLIFIGDALGKLSNEYREDEPFEGRSLIELAAAKMDEAALGRAPVVHSGALKLRDGRRVHFRFLLLPLAENGVDVTHIFGAASGKIMDVAVKSEAAD